MTLVHILMDMDSVVITAATESGFALQDRPASAVVYSLKLRADELSWERCSVEMGAAEVIAAELKSECDKATNERTSHSVRAATYVEATLLPCAGIRGVRCTEPPTQAG